MIFIVVAVMFGFLGVVSHGVQTQDNAFLDGVFMQYESSIKADTQTALAALAKANNVNATTEAALATPQPMNLCAAGSTGCSLQATSTIQVVGSSNGYRIGGATATVTNANANTTLSEVDVSVVWTMTVTSAGQTVATQTARQTYALTNAPPYAVPEGDGGSQVRGVLGAGARPEDYAGGCNSATGVGCGPGSSTASETDTRLSIQPTCAPNQDPAECSNAGTSKPADSYSQVTWGTTPQ